MKDPVIYLIRNVTNGKFYVGSTTQRYVRWRTHKKKLRSGTHHCHHLQAAWGKYGESNFQFVVVERVLDDADLQQAEDRWLEKHVGAPHCYNHGMRSGAPWRGVTGPAHPNYGKPMAEEQKEKLRVAAKMQWQESDPRTGRKHSAETRAKISGKVKAIVAAGGGGKFIPTAETRAKMSVANMGNQNAKGHARTAEHRRKLSEANRGNTHWKGKTHSAESREKMGRAVIAVDPDGTEHAYGTISQLRTALGMTPPTVNRALKSGRPLTKGTRVGWSFRYA